MPAILEFTPTHTATRPSRSPDLAFTALPLLNRLRDALQKAAAAMLRAREAKRRAGRWGVPKLFFFDTVAQAELFAATGGSAHPKALPSVAANNLSDMLEDAQLILDESLDVRRAARATPRLYEAARKAGAELEPARQLAELLRMPEGEAIRVIHPSAGAGYRILTHGVATVNQFHTLLADRTTGSPDRGLLPGGRPTAGAMRAVGGCDPFQGEEVAQARFQFLRPTALSNDGTIPEGFRSSDHWFWGGESLAEFPLENGERIVLIDEPVFETTWVVERKFPRIAAEVEVLDVMSRGEVEGWLRKRCPGYAPMRRVRERIAA